MIESPEAARKMACPMVLQAVVDDLQLLLSLPVTPFTYQVVLARAVGTAANNISATTHVNFLDCTVSSLPLYGLYWAYRLPCEEKNRRLRASESGQTCGQRMHSPTLFVNVKFLDMRKIGCLSFTQQLCVTRSALAYRQVPHARLGEQAQPLLLSPFAPCRTDLGGFMCGVVRPDSALMPVAPLHRIAAALAVH